jgi:5-formyltetrahydrofolate cyclo-ligase
MAMMDSDGITKVAIRETVKKRLAAIAPAEYAGFNTVINELFLDLERVKRATSIMIYYSIGDEVETVLIIRKLLFMNKTVSLPVCTASKNLMAGIITDPAQLITTRFGLKEPDPHQLISPDFIDMIVVPGLAFDERGFRLGRGAGYYDRFLSGRPNSFKLGLAYDFQVFPCIPAEPHDIRMDGLLTPVGYREF